MSDLKSALKETKNCIKAGDFQGAEKFCKVALKADKKSYQALVLFGKVNQELHKYADSKKVLTLATQVDHDQPVAWQGLSSLHEKHPDVFTEQESLTLLNNLLKIFQEENKFDDIHRRIARIYQEESPLKASSELRALLRKLKDKNRIYDAWKSIIDLLSSIKSPSSEEADLLLEALENVLNDSILGDNEGNYKTYLSLLNKMKDYNRLLLAARQMSEIFPTAYPLEWIAKIYVQTKENNLEAAIEEEDLTMLMEKLFRLNEGSAWGNMAIGMTFRKGGDYESAKPYFRIAVEKLKTYLFSWVMLIESQQATSDVSGCEVSCRKVLKLIETNAIESFTLPQNVIDFGSFVQQMLLTQAKALCKLGHQSHLAQAIDILEKQPEPSSELSILLIKAYLQVGDTSNAREKLSLLETVDDNSDDEFSLKISILKASVCYYVGDIDGAKDIYVNILAINSLCAEALFELGKIQYQEGNYQKSLISLLKAAKFDPKMGQAFLYLGHYYFSQDNLEKAKKCYEKALGIEGMSEEVGAALSDVYRKLGDNNSNLALLERVTSDLGRSGGGWAWFRLGLHYINLQNYNEAVKALQYAVQIDPKSSMWTECLGDAYLIRGSLNAALRMFQRSIFLGGTDTLYQKCQIARIKHLIGEDLSSECEYEEILSSNPSDSIKIVASIGLAQTLFARACDHKKQKFFSNVKDACTRIIHCLSSIAKVASRYITLWKLLGDSCTLIDNMPYSLSTFTIPKILLCTSASEDELTEISREEVLQLGARCYGAGLQISNTNALLWHDLGMNLLIQGRAQMSDLQNSKMELQEKVESEIEKDTVDLDKCLIKAISCLKKSLELNPSNSNAWNNLAVAAFFKKEYSLCQHCLIKSIEIQPSVEAWTHLGCLYLIHTETQLAHEAFSRAQAQDPSKVMPWVGQALVAESVGHHDTLDLFRHSNLLGIESEACLGLAHFVIKNSCEQSSTSTSQKIKALFATTADALDFYSREKEADVVALNMYGLSLEMNKLTNIASHAYEKAATAVTKHDYIPTPLIDTVKSNNGRILATVQRLEDADKCYSELKESDFYSLCGLALTKLKLGNFEAAYQNYSSALYWLSEDSIQKCHLYVALAFLQYKFKQLEQVKTLLFQSSCGDNTSVPGLFALTSLGLVQSDPTLTAAALSELESFKDNQDYLCDVAFLQTVCLIVEGKIHEAKLLLSVAIRKHPQNAALWRHLSRLLLTCSPTSTKKMSQQGKIIASAKQTEAASAAAKMARVLSQTSGERELAMEDCIAEVMAYLRASKFESSVKRGKDKRKATDTEYIKHKALLEAQRCVVMCPSSAESGALLVAAINNKTKKSQLANFWASKTSEPKLKGWLEKHACINIH